MGTFFFLLLLPCVQILAHTEEYCQTGAHLSMEKHVAQTVAYSHEVML